MSISFKNLIKNQSFLIGILVVFQVVMIFINNAQMSLWDQDESAYAFFAQNMIESGNWVIPEATWSEIHRKPPFHFWNIALSFKIFGINEFALRLPAGIHALLTYITMFLGGRKLFGFKAAYIGTLILSTSFLVPFFAKISLVDSTLLFFTVVCGFAIINILKQKSLKWTLIFWSSFALAILTKGPPIIIFSGILVAVLFILHPNRKNLLSLHPWFGLPFALIPFTIWGYATYLQDGGTFLNWMYEWYIVKRINSSVLGQTGPPGTHLIIIIASFFPYLLFIPKTIFQLVKDMIQKKESALILGSWFFAGWFIYELSPSKLPSYVLVAHLPFAFLIGKHLLKVKEISNRQRAIHSILQIGLISTLFIIPFLIELPSETNIILFSASIILLAFILWTFFLKQVEAFKMGVLLYGLAFQFIFCGFLLPEMDQFKNCTKRMAHSIETVYNKDNRIVIGNKKWSPPSLPFYLKQSFKDIQITNERHELMMAFFSDSNTVFILNKDQFNRLTDLIPGLVSHKFSNLELNEDFKNEYVITSNNQLFLQKDTILIKEPKQPLPLAHFQENIKNSKKWMESLKKRALEREISVEEAYERECLWLHDKQLKVYQFDSTMRTNQNWLNLLAPIATKQNKTLEKVCAEQALSMFD